MLLRFHGFATIKVCENVLHQLEISTILYYFACACITYIYIPDELGIVPKFARSHLFLHVGRRIREPCTVSPVYDAEIVQMFGIRFSISALHCLNG